MLRWLHSCVRIANRNYLSSHTIFQTARFTGSNFCKHKLSPLRWDVERHFSNAAEWFISLYLHSRRCESLQRVSRFPRCETDLKSSKRTIFYCFSIFICQSSGGVGKIVGQRIIRTLFISWVTNAVNHGLRLTRDWYLWLIKGLNHLFGKL